MSSFLVKMIVSLILISTSLFAEEPKTLSFTQFPKENEEKILSFAELWNKQEVTIRGFLYKSSDGRWILSPEPNLKSCCVGSSHKRSQQIVLHTEIEFSINSFPVLVQGYFQVEREKNVQGNIVQSYSIDHPQIIEQSKSYSKLSLAMVFIVGVLAFCIQKRSYRSS